MNFINDFFHGSILTQTGLNEYDIISSMNKLKVKTLYMGLTDFCNLSCTMCPQRDERMKKKTKGFIATDLVRKITESLHMIADQELHLFLMWLGESTMHPQFEEIIKIIKDSEKKISKIVLYTNGFDFDSIGHLLQIIEIPVQIIISLDSASASIYYQIKGLKIYDILETNAKEFIKKSNKYDHVEISIQFLIMKKNFSEILKFKEIWSEYFEKNDISYGIVSDYNLQDYSAHKINIVYRRTTTENMELSNELYLKGLSQLSLLPHTRYIDNSENDACKVCTAPFRNITVDWDGKVTFCCYDTYSELDIGNLNQDTLQDIWWGEKAESIRTSIFRNVNVPELCKSCDGFDAPDFTEEEFKKISKKYG